jgi:AraC family transcriptional regulator
MYLPEHEHVETQIQTCFRPREDSAGLQPHRSSLYAPGQPHRGAIADNWEVVVMLLEPRLMTQAADELFSRDRFEIKPFSLMRSPMAEQLTEAALGEFRSAHGPGLFYMESIGHVMSRYILRHHAVTGSPRPVRGKFSPSQLYRIDRFIDERLGVHFSIRELAALMNLGPQRFTERFRMTTGLPPWQYVQARRVRKAQDLLAHRKTALAQIALAVGFCSQSHFTNVFRQATGVTPRQYRNHNA